MKSIQFRPLLWPTLFSLVSFLVLISLGTWQVKRLFWKNNIISNMNFALTQYPDIKNFKFSDFKIVSKIKPSKKTFENLIFAFNLLTT